MLDHWASYSLVDFIPIEMSVYVNLFSRANNDLWPWTILFFLFGSVLVLLVYVKKSRYALMLLGLAWCYCAYLFHYKLLGELHWIGDILAMFFLVQGLLLLAASFVLKMDLINNQGQFRVGLSIMLLAMIGFVIQPIYFDRSWQTAEIFGLAPNPIVWSSIGMFISHNIRRWWLFVVPIFWIVLSISVMSASN